MANAKGLLIATVGAVALAGCVHTAVEEEVEVVSVRFDPDHYHQADVVSMARAQCRARDYMGVEAHSSQAATRADGWHYQTFACVEPMKK